MPFEPNEFLAVAQTIGSQGASEAALRTAVSRAYDAAFLTARSSLGIVGRRRIHHRVISALKNIDRQTGDQLDKLERLRGYADYEMDVRSPFLSDWEANWRKARAFASFVMTRIP